MSDTERTENSEHYDQRPREKEATPPIEVPMEALSADALRGVIDSFIWREGTDYGAAEAAHDTKVQQIRRQIEKGDVKIVFDPNTESVTLMTDRDWRRSQTPSA